MKELLPKNLFSMTCILSGKKYIQVTHIYFVIENQIFLRIFVLVITNETTFTKETFFFL